MFFYYFQRCKDSWPYGSLRFKHAFGPGFDSRRVNSIVTIVETCTCIFGGDSEKKTPSRTDSRAVPRCSLLQTSFWKIIPLLLLLPDANIPDTVCRYSGK